MSKNYAIDETIAFVKSKLMHEATGHDWWHAYRVWQNAKLILQNETADTFVVELAALLHDIADHKFNGGDETLGPRIAKKHLQNLNVPTVQIDHVYNIIESISFSKDMAPVTMEGKIVQDADRLDAIGAIGIARTFAYGGFRNRQIYNPDIKPEIFHNREDYKKTESPTINHFYEKLLLLKRKMNTETARKIANERHRFMKEYLDRFFDEWDGKC